MTKKKLPTLGENIRCEIAAGIARNHMGYPDLAKKTGIPYSTLRYRLNQKKPENIMGMTLGELSAIREVLSNA